MSSGGRVIDHWEMPIKLKILQRKRQLPQLGSGPAVCDSPSTCLYLFPFDIRFISRQTHYPLQRIVICSYKPNLWGPTVATYVGMHGYVGRCYCNPCLCTLFITAIPAYVCLLINIKSRAVRGVVCQ